eukprot:gene4410-14535_t
MRPLLRKTLATPEDNTGSRDGDDEPAGGGKDNSGSADGRQREAFGQQNRDSNVVEDPSAPSFMDGVNW